MRDQSGEVKRNQTSSQAFLLSRSDIADPAAGYGALSDEAAAWTIEVLSGDFPDLIRPGQIREAAAGRLKKTKRFAVAAVRIDAFHLVADPEAAVLDIAGITDALSREKCGFWGVAEQDMLALFLPGADAAAAEAAADDLRARIAERREETVTIGIAAYPLLDYKKADIPANAQKAVAHAEFFGPDSRAVFDAVSLNISGDKYYQAGDIDGAMAEFKKALALDAENVNVLNSLGVCHGVREEYDAALECFLEAVRLDPQEILAVYNAGYVCMCKGETGRALEFFHQAEALDPNVFEVVFQAGRVYLETGQYINAKKYLERAVELNAESGAAHRYLGDCYMQLDRAADAATAYKNALKMRPDDAEAISALGYLYEMQDRNADIALMFCLRAVQADPDNCLFRHRLGRVYYNRNRFDEALAEFEAAKDLGDTASADYISMIRGRDKRVMSDG